PDRPLHPRSPPGPHPGHDPGGGRARRADDLRGAGQGDRLGRPHVRQRERRHGAVPALSPGTAQRDGSSTSLPTNGRSASGTTTEPSACWWFSRIATSQRVVASVPLSVAAVWG